ncbi:MAG TPA: hypothetical protein VIJ32_05785 [Actinomycetes bacterium]
MTTTDQARRFADIAGALRSARELIAHDRWTAEELAAHQRRRLERLVRHATASSRFYRERYAGLDPGDPVELRRLPAIDKATVMERFDDLVCDQRLTLAAVEAHLDGLTRDELLLGRYRAMATGGSTGRKGVFVADRAEWRQYLAGFFRWNHYVGLAPRLPRRRRIASIAAARPLHMTYRMAAEQLDGRLRIAPAVIASSGETHTDELRQAIRAAWETSSFELYAMTEAGILGSHCDRHTGIHLFEDQAIVEVVDERDHPVPGRPGRPQPAGHQPGHPDPAADPLRGLGHGRGIRRALPLRPPVPAAGRHRRPQRRHPVPAGGRRGHGRGPPAGPAQCPGRHPRAGPVQGGPRHRRPARPDRPAPRRRR